MNYIGDTINTDVLIIGGGLAGARSALEAYEHRADVTMVVKGGFGGSGATALPNWIGGINVPNGDTDPLDSPETELKDILRMGEGMCDKRLARILAYETEERMNELLRWGLAGIVEADGKYSQIRACFSSKPRTVRTTGLGMAPSMLAVLKQQIEKRDIRIIENVMVAALLIRDGNCIGALGVDKHGKFLALNAKSIVLATGGAAALFPHAMYPLDATGDGYSLGFHAGAELFNMEFIQIGLGMVHPVLLQLYPDICNSAGENFLSRYLPDELTVEKCFNERINHYPFSVRDNGKYVDIAVYKEIIEGRETKSKGVYLDFTRMSQKDLEKSVERTMGGAFGGIESALNRLRANGVNVLEKPLETIPCAHAFNGGLKINERGETKVPGLYAVGETAGGPHGADRLGGGMLAACLVFGTRAGRFAAERAMSQEKITINDKELTQPCDRVSTLAAGKGKISTREVENKINDSIYRSCLTVRNQEGLKGCIEELRRMREEDIPRLSMEGDNPLFRALQIQNLLDVGQMVAYAALQRRESRGCHFREDFPERDDENWLRSINITKENLQFQEKGA